MPTSSQSNQKRPTWNSWDSPHDSADPPEEPWTNSGLDGPRHTPHWGQTPIYPLGTWWVHGGFWNKIPSMDPPGPFWLLFDYFYNLPTQIPTRYMLSIFKKYLAQNLLRVVLIYPLGSFWLILHFAHNSLTQIPTGYILSIFTKYPPRYPPRTQWVNVGRITSKTLDSFHNSHKKVPDRYFVKEPLGFFQKWPHNVLVVCLSHPFWVCQGFI